MKVKELMHVTPLYVNIVYMDKDTKEHIDYKKMHRKEREEFRNRNIYIIEPQFHKIYCYVY